MLIRQRRSFLDGLLLQVVFPYIHDLDARGPRRLLALARLWDEDVTDGEAAERTHPLALIRDGWRRVASTVWLSTARQTTH